MSVLRRLKRNWSQTSTVAIDWKYDLGGNVRNVKAVYPYPMGGTAAGHDHWYLYDAMDRFTLVQGQLTGSAIQRGSDGTELTYDAAGNRASTIHTEYGRYRIGHEIDEFSGKPRPVYETYAKDVIETYRYTADGYLAEVSVARGSWSSSDQTGHYVAPVVPGELVARDARDAMGRLVLHQEYVAGALTHEAASTHDRSGLLTQTVSKTRTSSPTGYYYAQTTSTYDYRLAGSGAYDGGWQGVVTRLRTSTTHQSYGGGALPATPTPATQTLYNHVWIDDAQQSGITHDSNTGSGADPIQTSTFSRDVNGRVSHVNIRDGRPRNVTFVTDANGQVLKRTEQDNVSTQADPWSRYLYFNGQRLGELTNDGPGKTDYAAMVANRGAANTSPFQAGGQTPLGAFDAAYDALNPGSVRAAGQAWTVQDGDTLQSIAAAAWGDASLWYLIADANGLTSASILTAGQLITVPAKVANVHHTSETFRPYDPNKALGDLNPTRQAQPKPVAQQGKKGGCGVIGKVIAVAIAVAIVVITKGAMTNVAGSVLNAAGIGTAAGTGGAAAATAAGASLAAAAGSVASQGFLVATGAQDRIDWKGVGINALSAGFNAGLAGGFNSAVQDVVRNAHVAAGITGAAANVLTQGVAVAVGLQDRFDWTGVAVAGIASGVGSYAGTRLGVPGSNTPLSQWTARDHAAFGGMTLATSAAAAGTQSLLEGTSFGDNLIATLPQVIGATLGNMVAGQVGAGAETRRLRAVQQGRASGPAYESLDPLPDIQLAPLDAWLPRVTPSVLMSLGQDAAAAAQAGAAQDFQNTDWGVSPGGSGPAHQDYVARDIQTERLSATQARVTWINHLNKPVSHTFGVGEGQYLHITDRGPVRDYLDGRSRGQEFYLYDDMAVMGPATQLEDVVVTGEWTAGGRAHQVLNYAFAVPAGVLNGAIVQPVRGLAELGGSTVSMGWDYGVSAFSSDSGARSRANQRNTDRWGAVGDTLQGVGDFAYRYSTDHTGLFKAQLAAAWIDRVNDGPMGLFNATSDITSVATVFVPGTQVGKVGQAGRVAHVADEIGEIGSLVGAAESEVLATNNFVPNPYGKLGGPQHQAIVADITADIRLRGLTPKPELRILTPDGAKSARFVDVVAIDPVTKLPVEYYQVGRQTLAGNPISREAQAIRDIQQVTNQPITFKPYNLTGN